MEILSEVSQIFYIVLEIARDGYSCLPRSGSSFLK